MTNRANVKVLHESQTGLNDRLSINGVTYTNNQAYNAAIQGKIDGYHGVNNNGTKFIRSNPDKSKRNNLD
ncbi:DUF3892 domain-containing protein [Thomasclavelia sp.]|uniref:DUF3892 domain-containing protein n=1 Tax=Thomasclavelia sp. TaxID=3025757 RepID=UPI0025CC27AF|nr:DUF3892 domain-containing protein [Thomasclavelia sp.]